LAIGIIVLFICSNIVSGLNIQLKNTAFPLINTHGYIQGLIDNASDGDTIFIPSGMYYENIIINKSISLVGESKETTIIDGCGNGNVTSIVSDWVNINGFTIQNSGDNWFDAGIKIFSNHTLIMDNIISNNNCGIYLDDYCDNNIITDNNINSNIHDGIFLDYYSDNNIITGNNINSNIHHGIFIRLYSGKNIITGNNISNSDDGIYLWESSGNNITGNNISSNNWYGIYLDDSSGNIITGNNFSNNIGYGIILDSSNNNIITSNNILNNDKGISLHYSSGNRITSNKIISNNEYGIHIMGDNNKIEGNNISSNKKYGIYLSGDQYNLYSSNSILKNNFICNRRHAYFETAFRTQWSKNYWKGVISPHVRIFGMRSFYILDITGYNIIWELRFPWFNFDWYPAKEPYDIGV
jgi:parallel beta-helix repeat protein